MKKFLLGACGLLLSVVCGLQAEIVLDLGFDANGPVDKTGTAACQSHNLVFSETDGGTVAEFDGASALMVDPDPRLNFGPTDVFWAEMKLSPLNLSQSAVLLLKGTGTNYSITLEPDGCVIFSYYSSGDWRTVASRPGSIPVETLSHLAVFFDSSAGFAVILVDGVVSGAAKDLPPFQSEQDLPLYIGGKPVGETGNEYEGYDGELSLLRLSKENPWNLHAEVEVGQKPPGVPPLK